MERAKETEQGISVAEYLRSIGIATDIALTDTSLSRFCPFAQSEEQPSKQR